MCDPISLAVIGLTAATSMGTAFMQSGIAKGQAEIEQTQLRTEIENERIKAMGDTNDRLEQFRKDEAANRAMLSTMGLAENMSYTGGILPANREVARRDIRNIGFNAGQQIGRKKYEIGVAGWTAKTNSRSAWMTAGSDIAGSIGSTLINRPGGNAKYQPVYN